MPEHILAFDFGMKRIGVAVGQTITRTATALPFLHAKDGIPNWQKISQLIQTWHPQKCIVGLPLTMEDEEQSMTFCARKFARRLHARFDLKVIFVDERLSTIAAREILFDTGGYKALQKGKIDSMAARILLEDWLLGY